MARIEDLIPTETKNKLKNIKFDNMKVFKGFVGATPNLNSSLGVNAADGENGYIDQNGEFVAYSTTPTEEKKSSGVAEFWDKNSSWITGIGGALLGGATTPATGGVAYKPTEEKKGIPAWVWILVAIVVLVIAVIVIKKYNK